VRGARRILIGALAIVVGSAAQLASQRDDRPQATTEVGASTQGGEPAARWPGSERRLTGARSAPGVVSRSNPGRDVTQSSGRSTPRPEAIDGVGARTPSPSPDEDPRRMGHAEASSSWPVLHPPVVAADRLTARIEGHDPIGGRTILLWRRGTDDTLLLQRTRSDPDGRFDFGELPVPNGDHALVVTSERGDPLSASPTVSTRPELPPPRFASMIDADTVRVDLHPAVLDGELQVMDDAEVVWQRIAVGRDASVVEIAGEDLARNHSVVQVLRDGRRSTRTLIHIAATAR
jgi:hypothetical protein